MSMEIQKLKIDPKVIRLNNVIERTTNRCVRGYDRAKSFARLGGRKANYDDGAFEFEGGACDRDRFGAGDLEQGGFSSTQ